MRESSIRKIIQAAPIIGLAFFLGVALYAYHRGIFHSTQSLQIFIGQFGKFAVGIFILLQIVQVVIPILPGGISSVVGMLMFGTVSGLIYSYIGLVIGEAIGFLLIRHYGPGFARMLLSPKKFEKFDQLLTDRTQDIKKLLIGTMLIPFAPDDLICLVAGLTKISFREFMQIVLILKPWSVGVYSLILLYFFNKAHGM